MDTAEELLTEEITEDSAGKILDAIYNHALEGIPFVSKSIDDLADDSLNHHSSPKAAAETLVLNQILKCGTSGFITGLGGFITLPIAIPANISSVIYVQLRMIAAIAKMGGYDIRSDQVQTMIYMCLTGTAVSDLVKDVGIKLGKKTLEAAIKKIPGNTLVKINQKLGFRVLTKFGEKGLINLGKLIPFAGGVIGGGFDAVTTFGISRQAIAIFINSKDIKDLSVLETQIGESNPSDALF